MRPRTILFIFGILITLVSILALMKNAIPPNIVGSAISDKLVNVPSSPTLYFILFLILGIAAIIISIIERKVIY